MKVVSSTSANTGVAPTSATTSAVAQKVKDGQITASPGPMPLAISASTSASVPLAQVTAWRAPQNAASSASNVAHLRAQDELAMIEHARDRGIDRAAKAAALRGDVDERNRWAARAGLFIGTSH